MKAVLIIFAMVALVASGSATSMYGGWGTIDQGDAIKLREYINSDNARAYRELLTSLLENGGAINFNDPDPVEVQDQDNGLMYVHRPGDTYSFWVLPDYLREP
jgi:hypothetical protein